MRGYSPLHGTSVAGEEECGDLQTPAVEVSAGRSPFLTRAAHIYGDWDTEWSSASLRPSTWGSLARHDSFDCSFIKRPSPPPPKLEGSQCRENPAAFLVYFPIKHLYCSFRTTRPKESTVNPKPGSRQNAGKRLFNMEKYPAVSHTCQQRPPPAPANWINNRGPMHSWGKADLHGAGLRPTGGSGRVVFAYLFIYL